MCYERPGSSVGKARRPVGAHRHRREQVRPRREYLAHLLDRNYSPLTVRSYGYDLLAFCRWLIERDTRIEDVTTDDLLDFLRACREASVPGRPRTERVRHGRATARTNTQPQPSTGASQRSRDCSPMWDCGILIVVTPVPKGREAKWRNPNARACWRTRSGARPAVGAAVAEPAAPPDGVIADRRKDSCGKSAHLAGSGDRGAHAVVRAAIDGGPRRRVKDVDFGARWVTVTGKGRSSAVSRWTRTSRR